MNTMRRYPLFLNEFALKIIAFVLMTCDHIGLFLEPYYPTAALILRAVGRLAFPLFAFMLAEGMRHTRNKWNYIARLSAIWVPITIVQVIYLYGLGNDPTQMLGNPFSDLICAALFIACLSLSGWKKSLSLLPLGFVLICYVSQLRMGNAEQSDLYYLPGFFQCGYGLYGFLMIMGFYYAPKILDKIAESTLGDSGVTLENYKGSKEYRAYCNAISIIAFSLVVFAFWGLGKIPSYDWSGLSKPDFETWALLCIPFLLCYNGKRGYDAKWFRYFSYLYFPVHMILLFLIFYLLFRA